MDDESFRVVCRGKCIAGVSTVKMEASFGRHFLAILFLYTAPHPVRSPILESSARDIGVDRIFFVDVEMFLTI